MKRALLVLLAALAAAAIGCGGEDPERRDGGGGGDVDGGGTPFDAGPLPDGAPMPRVDSGIDGGGACVPTIEICGDRIDQDCDGRDTGCGDNDGDGVMACRAGDDLTRCDCDDSRADVRPPLGPGVPGAPELCDGRDNDCNGRVDESSECCDGCASLGADRDRADVCTEDGTCDCSTEPGLGACPAGETCCSMGCTNTDTDFQNCGFCGARCTVSADRCTAGECRCGAGPVCDLDRACGGGSC